MCMNCGCSETASPRMTVLETGQPNSMGQHQHIHRHDDHDHPPNHFNHSSIDRDHTVNLEQAILSKNNQLASPQS